ADALLARKDGLAHGAADAVHNAGVGGHRVVGGDVEDVALGGGLLADRGQVVGVGEGVLGDGQAGSFQLSLDHVHLVLAVGLCRAVEQAHGLGVRHPLHNHGRLLVQGGQVGGARDVAAHRAAEIVDAQGHAVFGDGGAQDGDVGGGGLGRLQGGGAVGHDQVHAGRDEAVADGGAGRGIVLGVLQVKSDGVAQLLGQRI